MCHYSHCRRLWQSGTEKEGKGEAETEGRVGWMQISQTNGGINGKQKKGEEVFQAIDWLRRVWTSKPSENVSNVWLWVAQLHGMLSVPCPASCSFARCGWSLQWYTQPLQFYIIPRAFSVSHRLPPLSCTWCSPMWRKRLVRTALHSGLHSLNRPIHTS